VILDTRTTLRIPGLGTDGNWRTSEAGVDHTDEMCRLPVFEIEERGKATEAKISRDLCGSDLQEIGHLCHVKVGPQVRDLPTSDFQDLFPLTVRWNS
jgi:hypothetical protein